MKTTFLETVRHSDGQRRYYVGGCRVRRNMFFRLGCRFNCFSTRDTGTHWHHRKEGDL